MSRRTDFSIGQRLALGFGLFFLAYTAVIAVFYSWHAASSTAQMEFTQEIAPLEERISRLERATYRVAVSLRNVLLEPTSERVAAFETNVADVNAALDALDRSTLAEEERPQRARMAQAAQQYLLNARAAVEERVEGRSDPTAEQRLTGFRFALLGYSDGLAADVNQRAQASLARIDALRARTTRGIVTLTLATAIVLLALTWATARSVAAPAKNLVRTAAALEGGDWKPALRLVPVQRAAPPRDEMRRIAAALGSAAQALEAREQRLRADRRVATAVASTLDRSRLAADALPQIVKHAGAEVGVLYSSGPDETLTPIASHALAGELPTVRFGEGVPGQAARSRSLLVLEDLPAESGFRVKLGYDEAPPRAVAAIPLLFQDAVHGVVLLASVRKFSAETLDFLEASATQLGVGLHNVSTYEQVQQLLESVRQANERVRAQNEELQAQNEEIQAQNEEIQAQNEELLQQSEELQRRAAELAEADNRKTKFLGVLAHELRNPMAPIANSIFILKNSKPGSEGALRAQTIIERQAAHLVRLIDDLLDITRITEGKIHLRREPVDVVGVARGCVEDLGAAFDQAGVTLAVDVPDEQIAVMGDATRLSQVLGNLLNNSLKFTPAGGRVSVSLRVDHAHGEAVIRVIDNGEGMESALLPRLFQPFSQGASSLARTNGGLGLGLALVRALVTMHGGSVSAHSDGPGRGAEFTVRLPLSTAENLVATNTRTTAVATGASIRRIMVIEDHVDAATTLRDALQMHGYEVVIAHSGPEALRKVRDFKPELVLCDIGLPGQDGYEVARALRADPQTRSAILIALTGYASDPDKREAQSAGFDLHVAKPLSLSGLPEIIARLGNRHPRELGGPT